MIDVTAALNGVTFGAGTSYRWAEWPTGLLSTPNIKVEDVNIAGRAGVLAGSDLLGSRRLVFDVWVLGTTLATAEQLAATLVAAFAPQSSDVALDVRLSGTPDEYRLYGRPRGAEVALGRLAKSGAVRVRCEFLATDPLRYSTTESTATTALTTATGGITFAATAPFVFGSAGTGSTMICTNAGTTPTPWVATFTGDLVAPELVHLGSGQRLSFPDAVLAVGETLVIDSTDRTALLNGTASRYSWLASTSQWFDLDPGSNSIMLLGASGAGTATITWRSAWA